MSSLVVANCVRAIISRSRTAGSASPPSAVAFGSVGKSSAGIVLHLRIEPVGRHLDGRLVLLDAHIGVRKDANDLEELLGWAASGDRPWQSTPHTCCGAQPEGRLPGTEVRCPLLPSARWQGTGVDVLFRSTIPWKSCSSRNRGRSCGQNQFHGGGDLRLTELKDGAPI